ncbi:hypothetical protein BC827DRAFT_1155589 [Russula dissimulans]|nr:hypothetical protein BC827DRAFT_1155589 [Russula dissimulans]
MKSYALSIFSAVLFVVGASAQITLNTPPTVVECTPVQLSWTGGTTPVTISSHNGADPYGAPIDTYTNVTSNPFQTPNAITLPGVGQTIGWTIVDKNGLTGITAPVTIQPGGTCSSATGSAGASASAAPSGSSASSATPASVASTPGSTAAAASSSPASGSKSPSSASNAGAAAASASSPSSSTSTSRPNAAMPMGVPYSAAGILGVVVAAVFA